MHGRTQADMQPGSAKADATSLDALGPVFHSVLGNLTSDYERKLAAKDQETQRMKDQIAALKAQVCMATVVMAD